MSSPAPPDGVCVTYSQQYRRCGKQGCSHCAPGGRGHGPYWYASWRDGGRKRSRYLGTQAPAAVGSDERREEGRGTPDATPRPTPLAPLRVRTLGGFAAWRGEDPIPPTAWASRRAATLFKYLLSAPGHRLPREEASEMLWPEGEPAASAGNLRTTVHRLRRVLDGRGAAASHLRLDGDMLILMPGGDQPPGEEWLDATAFAHAARAALAGQDAGPCRAALACYGGDYLPDDPYADWAAPTRTVLRQQYLGVLLHLAALCGARGEPEEAEGCLRRLLAAEPGHEDAAATLMGLLAAAGRRAEALRVYRALATALEDDLDVVPGAEVMALRARLVAQEAVPSAAGVAATRTYPAGRTNLPAPSSSFVGRAWEVAEIGEMLAAARLVTLTGPGGCGKTRLALGVATTRVAAHPDGVWLVELAALTRGSSGGAPLVAQAVAAALGVGEQPGQPLLATLSRFLESRDLLLVLDNCEHLIGACATLAAALLAACPRLRLLATSREGLRVHGEHTYPVPPLTAPDPAHLPPLEQLATYEAVQLFLERAQARRPELRLTAANAGAVVQICARLDGLPLAIELAAARVGVLPVEGVAARLNDRFLLLTGGPRTALPRQQTLRAALDWSWELLAANERTLLSRLSVFADGCTLEAAEAVWWGDGLEAGLVLDGLGGLVDKSLVQLDEREDSAPRYRLLETVHQYATERLAGKGERAATRDRHLAHFLALAEEALPALESVEQGAWLARLDREHDNMRGALTWADESGAADTVLQLAGALGHFWRWRGHYAEGQGWLEAALGGTHGRPEYRARALDGAGGVAHAQGDFARAVAWNEEALALRRSLGDRSSVADSLIALGSIAENQGDFARAATLFGESLALCRDVGDRRAISGALNALGWLMVCTSENERAVSLLEEALMLKRTLGDRAGISHSLNQLALVASQRGEHLRATVLQEECLALNRELGNTYGIADVLNNMGRAACWRGDHERAAVRFAESLRLSNESGARAGVMISLELLGRTGIASGQCGWAAQLCGAAQALREVLGARIPPFEIGNHDRALGAMREALGEEAFATSWAAGLAMPLGQAVALALA